MGIFRKSWKPQDDGHGEEIILMGCFFFSSPAETAEADIANPNGKLKTLLYYLQLLENKVVRSNTSISELWTLPFQMFAPDSTSCTVITSDTVLWKSLKRSGIIMLDEKATIFLKKI